MRRHVSLRLSVCGHAACLAWPTSLASADVITGVAANTAFVGALNQYCQLDLYVTFDQPFHRLGSVFDTEITLGGVTYADILHDDGSPAGGTWAPTSVTDPLAIDSFVTLGDVLGPGNTTGADPLWGPQQFDQGAIPDGAGWFNMNPNNFQSTAEFVTLFDTSGAVTYSGWAALAARIVLPIERARGATFSITAGFQWLYALDIFGFEYASGTFSFVTIPSPAVAPAGVIVACAWPSASRRRRRHAAC